MRDVKLRVWDVTDKRMYYNITNLSDINGFLMQYTGLRDKNGTETYERDIIFDGEIIDYVTFDKGCFCLGNSGYLVGELKEYEVVGNTYENPELVGDSDE